ncbi:MAG: class I SAM-dependent methyltransferase [Acidobacteria bacterium]|nr:class I SAM-dependent methyltransferase [Acidobacteriota bacterium]
MAPNILPTSLVSLPAPSGQLFVFQDRLIRLIHNSHVPNVQTFLNSRTAREFTESGRFVSTRILDQASRKELLFHNSFPNPLPGEEAWIAVEHDSVPFPASSHEWPSEMLHAAGKLTLEVANALLREELGIKDAIPYNILFRGAEPVFVDLLSIEKRKPQDSVWVAYAQFIRAFFLPLLAYQKFWLPTHQVFLARPEGLEPCEFYWLSNTLQKVSPLALLSPDSVPTGFDSAMRSSEALLDHGPLEEVPADSRSILRRLLKRLSQMLVRLTPPCRKSLRWSDYMLLQRSYTLENLAAKEAFVQDAIARFQPKRVLDVGCNTGHFSFLAARGGASVVAIDSNSLVVGELWRRAHAEKLDILPLVVSLSRPTPAIDGYPSFLDRARGAFDALLMLAVIHHMIVTDGSTLSEILARAAELTTGICVAEFVGPGDPFFRSLLKEQNDRSYEWLSTQTFEAVSRRHFKIIASRRLGDSHRWLYLLQKEA